MASRTVARIALIALGVWLALSGGTLYAFSAWEIELLQLCHLSANSLGGIYAAGMVGIGCGLIGGLIFDRAGPMASLLYGVVLTATGNFGLAAVLAREGCGGPVIIALLYGMLNAGSVALFQTGLFSNLLVAPKSSQGFVTGVVAAGYGLSAAFYTEVYATFLHKDLKLYFYVTGLIFAASGLVAMVLVPKLVALLRTPPGYSSVHAHNSQTNKVEPTTIGVPSAGVDEFVVEQVDDNSKQIWVPWQQIRSHDFWTFVLIFVLLQSVGGGIFIGNLSMMGASLGIPEVQRLTGVCGTSFSNCFGRIAAGVLMDALEPQGITRASHTVWTAATILITSVLLATLPDEQVAANLYYSFDVVAFAYGANWAIMPSYLKTRFGDNNFGVCFNIHTLCLGLSVTLISQITGFLYGSASHTQVEKLCEGALCWRGVWQLAAMLSFVALVLALCLACVQRFLGRICTASILAVAPKEIK